jgi:glycosyltransferase involved in cell wall biosynthesis
MREETRVLEVVADGNPGGGTTHVLQVLRGLRSMFSLGLVTQHDSYLLNEARKLGITCFGVNFFRSRVDPQVRRRLRRPVGEFAPRLVHAHGGRAGFFLALARVQVPAVYTVHGYHFLHKSLAMRQLALLAERVASRSARQVIFVSEHDARVAQAYKLVTGSEQGSVIHNGVRLAEIPAAEPESLRHVGFIGRLEHPKDPFLFLDVMEQLPGYSATLVGGGALEVAVRDEVERRGLSQIRMTGPLAHSETLRALSEFSVLVMTSHWEAFGYTAVEAMWSGVPVVATNVGGLGEIIESRRSGLLVEGRSPGDLARAVMKVTENGMLRERIIEEGRKRVRDRFSEERMLSEISEVYRQVAAL